MGKVYVIEGLDGCGKHTQSTKLYEYLKAKGRDVVFFSFPAYASKSSALIQMYLNKEFCDKPEDLDCYKTSLFYVVDRLAQWEMHLKEAYNRGATIIFDRYVGSNLLHQGAKIDDKGKRREFYDWVTDLEFSKLGLPEPDKVIMLYADVMLSQALMSKRYDTDETKKDLHESDVDYLKKCYDIAFEVAEYSGWVPVNCCDEDGNMYTREEIFEEIKAKLGV